MEELKLELTGKTVICPVCKKHTALEESSGGITSWLCVNCGYTSNTMFVEGSDEFKKMPKTILNLKHYDADRSIYWIPTVINMPSRGLIFPEKHGRQIIWNYVPMMDIPPEEQKNYPIVGKENKFYTRKLDTDSTKQFTEFYEALVAMGAIIKLDELREKIITE